MARQLIWEQSYNSVGVEGICKAASVNKGSFYHFFPSKEALGVEALEHSWRQLEEFIMAPSFSTNLPPLERFNKFCENVHTFFSQAHGKKGATLGCPIGNMGGEVGTEDETLRAKVEDIFMRQLCYFEEALKEASEQGVIRVPAIKTKARCLQAFLSGIFLQMKVTGDFECLNLLLPGLACILGVEVRDRRMVRTTE